MSKQVGSIALECFVDLGITIVYATIVGLLIVAVVASDDGPSSLMASLFYASLLPAAVIALIAADIVLRVVSERRRLRRRRKKGHGDRGMTRFQPLTRPEHLACRVGENGMKSF